MVEGVGIDFGTGTSSIAIIKGPGAPPTFIRPYDKEDGILYLESAVAYDATTDKILTGRRAQRLNLRQRALGKEVCFPIKNYLGKADRFHLGPYPAVSAQEHAAFVIARLVKRAELHGMVPLDDILAAPVVITFPANADEAQKQATVEAVRLVGFRRIFGMAEPHAAAYTHLHQSREYVTRAYAHKRQSLRARREAMESDQTAKPHEKATLTKQIQEEERRLDGQLEELYRRMESKPFLVYDFGAGTFDAIIGEMNRDSQGELIFRVVGRDGKKHLGGIALTDRFTAAILEKQDFSRESIASLDMEVKFEIFEEAERLKLHLSSDIVGKITSMLEDTTKLQLLIHQTWTRSEFQEKVLKKSLQETIQVCLNALEEAKKTDARIRGPEDIGIIFLVGGSSRIPQVREVLRAAFRRAQISSLREVEFTDVALDESLAGRAAREATPGDPMTAVVGGAAIAAAMWTRAQREEKVEGRTFLEVLGVASRAPFSLWWNSGGDEKPCFELICDRRQELPFVHVEPNIEPIDPMAKRIAYSIWQSAKTAEELHARDYPRNDFVEVGRIQLQQIPGSDKRKIEMRINIGDDGELTIEANQAGGEAFKERVPITSVFVPHAGLGQEFSEAQTHILSYLATEDAQGL